MSTKQDDSWSRRQFLSTAALAGTGAILDCDLKHLPPSRRRRRRGSGWSSIRASAWRRSLSSRSFCEARGSPTSSTSSSNLDGLYPRPWRPARSTSAWHFAPPLVIQLDAGDPIVVLGGVHVGCFELFGTDRVRAIRDLKGKTVAIPELGMAAPRLPREHGGLRGSGSAQGHQLGRRIPAAEAMRLLAEGKIDAYMASRRTRRSCGRKRSDTSSSTARWTGRGPSTSAA